MMMIIIIIMTSLGHFKAQRNGSGASRIFLDFTHAPITHLSNLYWQTRGWIKQQHHQGSTAGPHAVPYTVWWRELNHSKMGYRQNLFSHSTLSNSVFWTLSFSFSHFTQPYSMFWTLSFSFSHFTQPYSMFWTPGVQFLSLHPTL